MKKYDKDQKIPMVFHYIFRFFFLPCFVVMNLLFAAEATGEMGAFGNLAFDILTVINVAVSVMLFVGLGKFTPKSYYLTLIFGVFLLLEGGLSFASTLEDHLFLFSALSGLVAFLGVFEVFYYIKRVCLFDGSGSFRGGKGKGHSESIVVAKSDPVSHGDTTL